MSGAADVPPGGRALDAMAGARRLNRWLYAKLAPHVAGDVLEIGAGIGSLSGFIVDAAQSALLTDVEPRYLDALARAFAGRPGVSVARYDLDGEPPPAVAVRRFDAIVAVNVLEHVADDAALVRRLAALLKPGGKLVVYVPAGAFAYGSLDRALGHHRRYTRRGLAALLAGAGLAAPPPAYMNLAGLIGWTVSARLLGAERVSPLLVGLFERLMPLVALEDHVRLPAGLGLHVAATRPG